MPSRSSTALEIPAPITIAETAGRKLFGLIVHQPKLVAGHVVPGAPGSEQAPRPFFDRTYSEHPALPLSSRVQPVRTVEPVWSDGLRMIGMDLCRPALGVPVDRHVSVFDIAVAPSALFACEERETLNYA
jgi:hypothetical protein